MAAEQVSREECNALAVHALAQLGTLFDALLTQLPPEVEVDDATFAAPILRVVAMQGRALALAGMSALDAEFANVPELRKMIYARGETERSASFPQQGY